MFASTTEAMTRGDPGHAPVRRLDERTGLIRLPSAGSCTRR
ncbi:hypothetical protein [Saccharopolyspora montiporae]|nr:hypothetical protein [Saccharopolyspora sp. HNM0983]